MPALAPALNSEFAADVTAGLARAGQKELPSRWLYDEIGSALFEAITLLPEYGLTRADGRLLRTHAAAIAAALPGNFAVAELGSGTGTKTRSVLEAFSQREAVDYYPIDVSAAALETCAAVLDSIPGVRVEGLNATYLDGLGEAVRRRAVGQRMLVLFLGSTIGNFDPLPRRRFLSDVRGILTTGDALLLGADLVKPLPQMLAAYDDPVGVTAAFNKNLLARINRGLDADFNLRRFDHEARFDQDESRIEMHLRSRLAQTVRLGATGAEIRFAKDETIWTESSYKFRRAEIVEMAAAAGFEARAQWVDAEWPFAETLLAVK